jgi:hypothetical protein
MSVRHSTPPLQVEPLEDRFLLSTTSALLVPLPVEPSSTVDSSSTPAVNPPAAQPPQDADDAPQQPVSAVATASAQPSGAVSSAAPTALAAAATTEQANEHDADSDQGRSALEGREYSSPPPPPTPATPPAPPSAPYLASADEQGTPHAEERYHEFPGREDRQEASHLLAVRQDPTRTVQIEPAFPVAHQSSEDAEIAGPPQLAAGSVATLVTRTSTQQPALPALPVQPLAAEERQNDAAPGTQEAEVVREQEEPPLGPMRTVRNESYADLHPESGNPLAGQLPVDLKTLQRNVDAFFSQLARLGQDGETGQVCLKLAPWLGVAAVLSWEVTVLRNKKRHRERYPDALFPFPFGYPPSEDA